MPTSALSDSSESRKRPRLSPGDYEIVDHGQRFSGNTVRDTAHVQYGNTYNFSDPSSKGEPHTLAPTGFPSENPYLRQPLDKRELKREEQTPYEGLLNSLTFDRMDSRLLNITNALSRTGEWVFKDATYREWLNRRELEEHQGFLWIKGKPGSGKSTIMKKIFKAFSNKKHGEDINLSYFFNARAPGRLEKSSLGMYRSLVYQILQSCSGIREQFIRTFSSKIRDSSVDWTEAELQGYLVDVVEVLDRPVNIFVDALDEGDVEDVRQLVDFLETMALQAVECQKPLRICLSSRHWPSIGIKRGLCFKLECQDGHKCDIDLYVRNKLNGQEGGRMEKLREKILQKSSAVFLWIVLVIPILNQLYNCGREMAMEKRLDDLPPRLDDLFAEILSRNTDEVDATVTLLRWVLFAQRPLSPVELYYATQLEPSSLSIDADVLASEKALNQHLLHSSRGLTELTKTDPPSVQFIHETVRSFLIHGRGLARIAPSGTANLEGACHELLKVASLRYLIEYLPCPPADTNHEGNSIHKESPITEHIRRSYPFTEYAVSYLFSHAEIAQARSVSQEVFIKQIQRSANGELLRWVHYRNLYQSFKVRRYTKEVHLLYILAEQNFPMLGRVLIDSKADVNVSGQRYGNALQAACAAGNEQMVRLLLNSSTNVKATGGERGYAFCAAIYYRHESIASLLHRRGGLPPPKTLEKLLFRVIARGYLKGVEILVDAGASLACRNGRGEDLLLFAANKNKFAIVELLLQKGGQMAFQKSSIDHLFLEAVTHCSKKRAELLLKYGANADAVDGHHGNALQTAAIRDSKDIVQLLLDNGANVNGHSGEYGRALQAAACTCSKDIVQLLLDEGADVNDKGGEYGYALQAAAWSGSKEVVQLLLDKGADVNGHGGIYGYALHAAVSWDYTEVVRLLIERGANVNAVSSEYGSALNLATTRGELDMVKLLVNNGANVNLKVEDHFSKDTYSYWKTTEHEKDRIARYLIEKGANKSVLQKFLIAD